MQIVIRENERTAYLHLCLTLSPMRILHVFSANLFTGSVAHALELAHWQQEQGHEVFLTSDLAQAPAGLRHVRVPIHNRRYPQRLRNATMIRKLVATHNIQVVHAHSRAASWVAKWALRGSRVALVSTVHGRQHVHFSSKNIDVFGQRIIAISDALKMHLVDDLKKDARKMVVIPNGVRFPETPALPAADACSLALIGRLSGPKGARAACLMAKVFPVLLEKYPQVSVTLVGGCNGAIPDDGDRLLQELTTRFPGRFRHTGFVEEVQPFIDGAGVVIGAGRVAIQALRSQRAVLALGEAAYGGWVRRDALPGLAEGNFGDTCPPDAGSLSPHRILQDLERWCTDAAFRDEQMAHAAALARWAEAGHDWKGIGPRILDVYSAAIMERLHPGYIPVLMYHKVPDAAFETPHRIFVTRDRFEKHLSLFRRRGLTPITFRDYEAFASGERNASDWPERPIVLTFDDGYEDNHTNLLPLMKRYGYRGVLFLLGNFNARHNFWDGPEEALYGRLMNLEQAKEFVSAGWEIGAHTLNHLRLDEHPEETVAQEVTASRKALEQQLNIPVQTFAYPYGHLNDSVKQVVARQGFRYAVATDSGGLRWEDDRFQIFRVNMFPEETTFSLWKKTSSWYRPYYRFKRGK